MLIQILNGLVYGGLLYLVAAGLVLIFGLRQIVNFAHGSLFMLGAYLLLSSLMFGNFWIGVLLSIVILALLGVVLDIVLFRPLRDRDHTVTVIITFGVLLISESLATNVWGRALRSVPTPPTLSGTVDIFGSAYPTYRLFVLAISLTIAAALWGWLEFTRTGLHIRAASVDPSTTAMQGVDTERLSLLVMGIGAGIAGLAGAISAPLVALSPSMGNSILIEAFVVVVVGGLGSFGGAFCAAIALGLVHNYGVLYFPTLATMLPFILMSAILIWHPTGLAGNRT